MHDLLVTTACMHDLPRPAQLTIPTRTAMAPQVQFVQFGPSWLALVLQLLPSFGLYRGLWELAQYAFLADASNGAGGGARLLRCDGWMLPT
jgi:hypothetical protein